MPDRNVSMFCNAADRAAANTKADSLGCGPNSFSVPLSTTQGVTNPALATTWAGSGYNAAAAVEVLEASVDPLIQVRSNDNKTFDQHLAESDPPLYRIYEPM